MIYDIEEQLDLVRSNGYNIIIIDNPSNEVQVEAINEITSYYSDNLEICISYLKRIRYKITYKEALNKLNNYIDMISACY